MQGSLGFLKIDGSTLWAALGQETVMTVSASLLHYSRSADVSYSLGKTSILVESFNLAIPRRRPQGFQTAKGRSRSLRLLLVSASQLTTQPKKHADHCSCFPIVPKLACEHLDLPTTRAAKPLTLLGGLTSFGGAGNNYSMHVRSQASAIIW